MDLIFDSQEIKIPVEDNTAEAGLRIFTNNKKNVNLCFASTRSGSLKRGDGTYDLVSPFEKIESQPYQLFDMKTNKTILEGNISVHPADKNVKQKKVVEESSVDKTKAKKNKTSESATVQDEKKDGNMT